MCTAEATASLLQAEETFSACLARIDALILKPLLQAGRSDKTIFYLFIYFLGNIFLNLESCSEAWKHHKTVLKQFFTDFTSESSMSLALYTVLHKPIRDHVERHVLLLTELNEALKEDPEKELVTSVIKEYVKLESFISQVLDEACFTKALWKSLGYKFTDVLCVPERRLLEDSRNLPISASTNRSDRILLFDDVLVLIQGNSFQSFDLKLVWVDKNCREKSAPGAVWQWKLNQAIRQALNGKRDFPLWGKTGEGTEPPSCRFFSYVFKLEGKFKSATYEGEWHWGKPHGKGTLKWPDGRNHVGDFKEGLEHGFGICLVPRRSEDRYDCYKCHWSQGKMRGYGICMVMKWSTKATSKMICVKDLGFWRAPQLIVHLNTPDNGKMTRRMDTESGMTKTGNEGMAQSWLEVSGSLPLHLEGKDCCFLRGHLVVTGRRCSDPCRGLKSLGSVT
uniref:ALS2 C-terminal like n=1 Tax=Nothoprocta perdicaria TaxID=30464 RepID=A0A8C6ZBA9_NOTPE